LESLLAIDPLVSMRAKNVFSAPAGQLTLFSFLVVGVQVVIPAGISHSRTLLNPDKLMVVLLLLVSVEVVS
jgi:hypothetical protein